MNLNLKQTEATFRKQRKQFNRISMMHRGWLVRHPPHIETFAVWALTALIVVINLEVFFVGPVRPLLLTAGLASVVLSAVLWLRWKKKPHNWPDLISGELVSYLPTDHDAFARLQQSILKEGRLDLYMLDEWVREEERAIRNKRKKGHDTEDRHHDNAQQS